MAATIDVAADAARRCGGDLYFGGNREGYSAVEGFIVGDVEQRIVTLEANRCTSHATPEILPSSLALRMPPLLCLLLAPLAKPNRHPAIFKPG